MTSRLAGDRGAVVLGWLTRLVIVLSVLGVIGIDAIALASARVSAEDHAHTAARAAVQAVRDGKDLQRAYDAALGEVVGHGDTIDAPTFTAAPDGSVTLTLRRQASTVLVDRVGPLRGWTMISSTVTGRPRT